MNVLPDSRPKETKSRIFTPIGTWIPIYCANCGADGGAVPEENMTFVCYLCPKCAETHGAIVGTMLMPDEVFFQKLKEEQIASYGHYLTEQELASVIEADSSSLATLIKSR